MSKPRREARAESGAQTGVNSRRASLRDWGVASSRGQTLAHQTAIRQIEVAEPVHFLPGFSRAHRRNLVEFLAPPTVFPRHDAGDEYVARYRLAHEGPV